MHYLLIFSMLLTLSLSWISYKTLTSPLRKIPGPFLARFTRLWYLRRLQLGRFHEDNITLHRKYGPIVRIAPKLYSISTPDKVVYGIASKFPKGAWYDAWKHPSPNRWTLFPDRNIQRHNDTRKRFQAMYSLSSVVHYETYVNECLQLFADQMRQFATTGEKVDLAHWFQCYAFDVIGHITYSKRFGFLDRGDDIGGLMKALSKTMIFSTLSGVYPELYPYMYALMEKLPSSGASGRTYIMGFVQERLKARNEYREKLVADTEKSNGRGTPKDFLDRLMDANRDDPTRITPYHIFMMGLSNIIAGSDTTAASLTGVFYHLLKNPLCLAKLQAEIQEADGQQNRDSDLFTFKETQEMPYLQAVIKEALRLHSTVGLPLWREVPAGGATIMGQYFPAGVDVGLNAWVAHNDAGVYGNDVDEFRPERWMSPETSGDVLKRMEDFYLPVC
jgi:cytochrome P450